MPDQDRTGGAAEQRQKGTAQGGCQTTPSGTLAGAVGGPVPAHLTEHDLAFDGGERPAAASAG